MIHIAVIGAGHWGPNLVRNLHDHSASEVRWIVDRDPKRLAQLAKRYPGIQTTGELSVALADPEVDAAVVATPSATHHEIAKAALLSGRDVLVEKPLTTNVAEAEDLCEVAEARGLVLMVGHVFLYNPAVHRVREYLRSGELGRVYYVSMERTNLGPIRVDVNAAWDLAAHDVSIASWWLGAEPESVSAVGGAWLNRGIEDAVFATLRYPEGVLVHLHASWLNPKKARGITVVGDRKMLTFDDMNLSEPIRIYDKHVSDETTVVDSFVSFRASVSEGAITIPRVALGEPLKAECDEFVACIAERRTPRSDGREGTSVVRVLDAIQRSLEAGGREERVKP